MDRYKMFDENIADMRFLDDYRNGILGNITFHEALVYDCERNYQ